MVACDGSLHVWNVASHSLGARPSLQTNKVLKTPPHPSAGPYQASQVEWVQRNDTWWLLVATNKGVFMCLPEDLKGEPHLRKALENYSLEADDVGRGARETLKLEHRQHRGQSWAHCDCDPLGVWSVVGDKCQYPQANLA